MAKSNQISKPNNTTRNNRDGLSVYMHTQTSCVRYDDNGPVAAQASESYSYNKPGPAGRVKGKKSSGFNLTRPADGHLEGDSWRNQTPGFAAEELQRGYGGGGLLGGSAIGNGSSIGSNNPIGRRSNGGNLLPNPGFTEEVFDSMERATGIQSGGIRTLFSADNAGACAPRQPQQSAIADAAFWGSGPSSTSLSYGPASSSSQRRPGSLGVERLQEESDPASYADSTPWRRQSQGSATGPVSSRSNASAYSTAPSRANSLFSNASDMSMGGLSDFGLPSSRESTTRPRFS